MWLIKIGEKELRRAVRFSYDVVRNGQNGLNYHNREHQRDERKRWADSYRGTLVEMAVCLSLGISLDNLDWATGKGASGATHDAGFDLILGGDKISINGIAQNCKYLMIPIKKFEAHQKVGVKYLILGTTEWSGKDGFNDFSEEQVLKKNGVNIDGWITLDEFFQKKKNYPKGSFAKGNFIGFSEDNYGVHKSDLYSWNEFKERNETK